MAAIISAQCAARVAPSKATTARKSAFSGKSVQARSVSLAAPRAARFGVFAADAPAKKEAAKEEEDGQAYLDRHNVQAAIKAALKEVIRERPMDPIAALSEVLKR